MFVDSGSNARVAHEGSVPCSSESMRCNPGQDPDAAKSSQVLNCLQFDCCHSNLFTNIEGLTKLQCSARRSRFAAGKLQIETRSSSLLGISRKLQESPRLRPCNPSCGEEKAGHDPVRCHAQCPCHCAGRRERQAGNKTLQYRA